MNTSGSTLPISENVQLAPYTTLGVGGPARFLAKARTEDHILDALDFARVRSCPVFVLGGGSNIVVSDTGFPGLVLKIEIPGIQSPDDAGGTRLSAGAGEDWDGFVRHCVNRNLAGIECLAGIPGTVGGTPIQNVGAYGEEVSDVIVGVRVLDRGSNNITELSSPDCQFTYRSSIFNTAQRNRYVILRVDFVLRSDGKPRIRYRDLQQRFGGTEPKISEVREAVLQIRKSKAMLLIDGDPDSRSVGSFFKNPILTSEASAGVEKAARSHRFLADSESLPHFEAPDGMMKLPAAWLIEHAGFHKGYALGRAGISGKHALAIINRGGATAKDILSLMGMIQNRVLTLFGVELQPEPVFIGFDEK